jgi:hypothetical protein
MQIRFPSVVSLIAVVVLLLASTGQAREATWVLSAELGDGNILGVTFSRILPRSFETGIGFGFDADREQVGTEQYSLFLMNFNALGAYHLYRRSGIDIAGRIQVGYNILFAGPDYSVAALDLTPGILAGYKNFYAILSGVCLFTRDFVFLPQTGIGYRIQF